MKAIIAEYQEQRVLSPTTNNEQYYMEDGSANYASPVYSLPDEDRTQIAETYTNNKLNDAGNYNMQYDRTQMPNIKQPVTDDNRASEIIDLCGDDDDQEKATKVLNKTLGSIITTEINADVNIHNALSNLSIRDMSITDERMDTDIECSQSILNNYDETNNVQRNNTSISVNVAGNMPINNVKGEHERIQQKETSKMPYQTTVITNPSKTVKPLAINLNTPNIRKDNGYNVNHPLIEKVSKAINNLFSNAEKPITDQNKSQTIVASPINNVISVVQKECTVAKNNNNNINDKENSLAIAEGLSTVAKILKDKTSNKNKKVKPPVAVKKKRAPRKKKSTEAQVKENRKLNTEIFIGPSFNYQKNNKTIETVPIKKYNRKKINCPNSLNHEELPIPIYNKNVVHDLSWLESIRYVREIGEDEYDRELANLTDDFWDNCLLPPSFDERDFEF